MHALVYNLHGNYHNFKNKKLLHTEICLKVKFIKLSIVHPLIKIEVCIITSMWSHYFQTHLKNKYAGVHIPDFHQNYLTLIIVNAELFFNICNYYYDLSGLLWAGQMSLLEAKGRLFFGEVMQHLYSDTLRMKRALL